MIASLLALSVSNTFLKVGALAAFAALLGIAVLSLLVFSQAREIKRLREWAGRAPERAAELEQRVSAEAAARVQRVAQPRATPIVARTAATPGQPSATPPPAGGVATPPAPFPPATVAGASAPATVAGAPAGASPATGSETPAPVPGQPAFVPTAQVAAAGAAAQPAGGPAQSEPAVEGGQPATVDEPGAVSAATGSGEAMGPGEATGSGEAKESDAAAKPDEAAQPEDSAKPSAAPQPETGAADAERRAGEETRRITSEEIPDGAPERVVATPAAAAVALASTGRVAQGASALKEAGAEDRVSSGVAAPATVAARAAGSTARGARPATPPRAERPTVPPRPPAPSSRGGAGLPPAVGAGGARAAGARGGRVQGPPFLQEQRSAGRTTALIVGGVVFGVAVLVGVLLSLGGGGGHPSAANTTASHKSSSGHQARRAHHAHTIAAVASPAETQVVVLNGTETTGLAHRLSTNLQQSGYTQSAALEAHPAAHATSVVQYTEGHRSEAREVAQTLGIGQVEALESGLTPLVGSATVVVVAGADQAALGSEG